jgi:ethanolamine utilization microcompartment shell protein EutL
MFNDRRKIQLIENLLKVDSDTTLREVEIVLNKSKKKISVKKKKKSAYDFLGIWTKEEAAEIEKIIEEGCEQIDHDGWK